MLKVQDECCYGRTALSIQAWEREGNIKLVHVYAGNSTSRSVMNTLTTIEKDNR